MPALLLLGPLCICVSMCAYERTFICAHHPTLHKFVHMYAYLLLL